ncbi:MAG: hypothetical protein A2Y10_05155 [Planctomycetes bacterium GWF2_41_51]|nr:MAG: hypothetical protein A2Y10_05155 [Planctomycetes bacterium GWF2_41_51]
MRNYPEKGKKTSIAAILIAMVIMISGCGANRPRWGYLPTATLGNPFPDPNELGTHSSGMGLFMEAAGLVYTCRGGHIDLDHVRGSADTTKYLAKKITETLAAKTEVFSFNMTGERSLHRITFAYPENWQQEPNKEKIIEQISIDTAPYIAMNAMTWHEIMTWFGVHFLGFEPEFNSAFSWEDIYSNLVGAKLGVAAMKDKEHSFDEAMTKLIYDALNELEVQSKKTAIAASRSMEGKWYSAGIIPDMKMRNFDIGLDGEITPTLVPDVAGCRECEPMTLKMPTVNTLKKYGFTMTHQIEPNVFEQDKILRAASSKVIFPERHFPILIEFMKKEAQGKGYSFAE